MTIHCTRTKKKSHTEGFAPLYDSFFVGIVLAYASWQSSCLCLFAVGRIPHHIAGCRIIADDHCPAIGQWCDAAADLRGFAPDYLRVMAYGRIVVIGDRLPIVILAFCCPVVYGCCGGELLSRASHIEVFAVIIAIAMAKSSVVGEAFSPRLCMVGEFVGPDQRRAAYLSAPIVVAGKKAVDLLLAELAAGRIAVVGIVVCVLPVIWIAGGSGLRACECPCIALPEFYLEFGKRPAGVGARLVGILKGEGIGRIDAEFVRALAPFI